MASLTLLQTYAARKGTMHDFHTVIFRKTLSSSGHLSRQKFRFFHMMKTFEQTVESKLDHSSGKHQTAAERNGRDRRDDTVRDVICDVTPLKCYFSLKCQF